MEVQKIINLYNLSMSDEVFFEALMANPISTLELNQKILDLNSEELISVKNMFSAECIISNKQLCMYIFRLAKGHLPPIPPPPPIIELLKYHLEHIN